MSEPADRAMPEDIRRDVALAFNTLRLPAVADLGVSVRDLATLRRIAAWQRAGGMPWTVLGGGSNVVLAPRVRQLVVCMAMRGIHVAEQPDDSALVHVAAGESWHTLVMAMLTRGLCGIENLALIPGTVGAAPVQNIGAYGVELREHCVSVDVYLWDEDRSLTLAGADCGFAYRDSRFRRDLRGRAVITGLCLRLQRHGAVRTHYGDIMRELAEAGVSTPTPAAVADAVIRIRRNKLPDLDQAGSVGSFFRNVDVDTPTRARLLRLDASLAAHLRSVPDGRTRVPAAALIERCGFKGQRVAAMEVWHQQPLVLVNHGGATFAEVMWLAGRIRDCVWQRFGIWLVLEPDIVA